jgi:hypothetical protein
MFDRTRSQRTHLYRAPLVTLRSEVHANLAHLLCEVLQPLLAFRVDSVPLEGGVRLEKGRGSKSNFRFLANDKLPVSRSAFLNPGKKRTRPGRSYKCTNINLIF